jgi:hypothetical protein
MLHLKIALICTLIGFALGAVIGRLGPAISANASVSAPAAQASQYASFATNPIVPADVNKSEQGPVRLTDW